jgi:hypothetical protein
MLTSPLKVMLTIGVRDAQAIANVSFNNPTDADIFLWDVLGCPGGDLQNNLFEIYLRDQRVAYTGLLAKRAQPAAEEFLRIAPGRSHETSIPLHTYYRFHPGENSYRARYLAFNPFPDRAGFSLLTSNEVTFRLAGK